MTNTLPEAPPGMITLPAPDGFSGYVFAPDPDGWLSATAVSRWLQKVIPPSLQAEHFVLQEAFARQHMLIFHIEGWQITDDLLMDPSAYPAAFAYLIVDATETLIAKARNKKK